MKRCSEISSNPARGISKFVAPLVKAIVGEYAACFAIVHFGIEEIGYPQKFLCRTFPYPGFLVASRILGDLGHGVHE